MNKIIIKKSFSAAIIYLVLILSVNATFNTYSFPESFIKNNKFTGEIVIGSNSTKDIIAANTIINFLTGNQTTTTNLNQNQNLIQITYQSTNNFDGESIDPVKSNSELNYGETIEQVMDSEGLTDKETDLLDDDEFDNDISDENYEQTLQLLNGEFNFALRDDVENVDTIRDGIYYDNNEEFAKYILDLDTPIDLTDTDDLEEDMVGKTLTILGNEYTITDIEADDKDLEMLELVGGFEKFTIEEGETKTIEINDEDFKIKINVVKDDKVSLMVNQDEDTINLYNTEDVGGISIAVTDLVDSSRESVPGFAELIIGGQIIELRDDNDQVKINDEDINDIYEKYDISSDFSDDNKGMKTITITYRVNEETLLEKKDFLEDVLFKSFALIYNGINNADFEYTDLEINVKSDDKISVNGILFNNEKFNREVIYTTTDNGINGETYFPGENEDSRIFFKGSNLNLFLPDGFTAVSGNEILIDFTNRNIENSGFLMSDDTDEQFLYIISGVDQSNKEIDLDEIFDDNQNEEIKPSRFEDKIDISLDDVIANDNSGTLQLNLDEFRNPIIAFENDFIMNVLNIESTGASGFLTFFYDDDISGDETDDEDENFNVLFDWDTDDDNLQLKINDNDIDFVNSRNANANDNNDDIKIFVTSYGTKIEYDNENKDSVIISIPNEQVRADIEINFDSDSNSFTKTITVKESDMNNKINELEDEGYTILKTRKIIDQSYLELDNLKYNITNIPQILLDTETDDLRNKIIIGGPAINKAAAQILGVKFPTYGEDTQVNKNEAMAKYYDAYNTLLIFGYETEDTQFAVETLLTKETNTQELFFRR